MHIGLRANVFSHDRPGSPDPDLLASALQAIPHVCGSDDRPLEWDIGRRIERSLSTLFPLRARMASGATVHAFYKVFHTDPETGFIRGAFPLARALGERFAALGAPEGILSARLLAVDPAVPALVALRVPGRPLGKPIWYLLSRSGRASAPAIYRKIGRAIQLIEQSGAHLHIETDQLAYYPEWITRNARAVLSRRDAQILGARTQALYDQALLDGDLVYAHGDLNHTNIYVDSSRIAFIDFAWIPRFRGYDLAGMMHWMEYAMPRIRSWSATLIEALLAGYGDSVVTSRPSWKITRLQRLIRTAQGGTLVAFGQRTRALKELQAELIS